MSNPAMEAAALAAKDACKEHGFVWDIHAFDAEFPAAVSAWLEHQTNEIWVSDSEGEALVVTDDEERQCLDTVRPLLKADVLEETE